MLALLLRLASVLCGVSLSCLFVAWLRWRRQCGKSRVQVLVLGDAGRSPRMQYHCLSLLKEGFAVDLVGCGGSSLIQELRMSERLMHHKLTEYSDFKGLPSVARLFIKVAFQTINLFWVMLRTKKPSHLLMQTPPSIPTLFVSVVVCYLRSSQLIVDYHNYGHTILALSLGRKHPFVKISDLYERSLSRFAHSNICVSEAMKKDLQMRLGISATVFYDRPPGRFKPSDLRQKHELFLKLSAENEEFRGDGDMNKKTSNTAFTEERAGHVTLRDDRPFLLISSTSWTEDEDFGILLDALEDYSMAADTSLLPNILCVITGKGPLREYYLKILQTKHMPRVKICTMWLSAEDYPVLLGSADLGVCLHKSSSGLDLPMKVVDMFGCGLPVCAVEFECLHELITHNYNGMMFADSSELSIQIQSLCCGFPNKNDNLTRYQENLSAFQTLRWDHYWKLHVLPLIKKS